MQENTQDNKNLNQDNLNSEFAKKEPLVKPETIRKFVRISFLIIGIVVFIFVSAFAYQMIFRQPQPLIQEPLVQKPLDNSPIDTKKSYFAYIKNEKSIWISDTDGIEKFSIVEFGIDSPSKVVSLRWKDSSNLGYSVCTNSICELMIYNFDTRSIVPSITSNNIIRKFNWSSNKEYFAYIETSGQNTLLKMKAGTIDTAFMSFPTGVDEYQTKMDVFFTKDK